jgi:hypothetical protein
VNENEARAALRAAWEATPFDPREVSRATALLLELVDYDVKRFAFGSHKTNRGDETCETKLQTGPFPAKETVASGTPPR